MGAGIQLAVGIVGGVAIFVAGAVFVGRAEGAVRAVAALGFAALGLMLLADILLAAGLIRVSGTSFSPVSLLVTGLQVGAISLALLALVLILMGGFIGIVWSAWRRRFADLAVLSIALAALAAGVVLTAASIFGRTPLSSAAQTKAMAFAGFGLGTLAAALIAFWAVPVVRSGAAAAGARSRDAA